MKETSVDIFQYTDYRQIAKDILDSYHHPWDYISELVQNAYSSILKARKLGIGNPPWKIEITLNQESGYFEIVDNGLGIPKESIPGMLAPGGRGKHFQQPELPSEKGLGLSFALLSSDRFEIESRYNGEVSAAIYQGAFDWIKKGLAQIPLLRWIKLKGRSGDENYTRIRVSGEQIDLDFSPNKLEYILRTRTAIGNVKAFFDKSVIMNFDIRMTHVDKKGKEMVKEVEPTYLFPSESWKRSISLEEYKEERARGLKKDYTDHALVVTADEGREKYYRAMYATPEVYDEIAKNMGLSPRKIDKGGEVLEDGDVNPAICVSVKGVPYGTTIDRPKTGAAGMWAGTYIIINHDDLIYDAGRKSFKDSKALRGVKRKIKEIFTSQLEPYFPSFARHPTGKIASDVLLDQSDLLQATQELPLLMIDLPYQKQPDNEQSTVALFHELVAKDYLKGYFTRANFSTEKIYDTIIDYIPPKEIGKRARRKYEKALKKRKGKLPIIAEFKHELSLIIKDIKREDKFGSPLLHLIICWSVDKKKIARAQWRLEEIPKEEAFFHGTGYRLYAPGASWAGVEVLVLDDFVKEIKGKK